MYAKKVLLFIRALTPLHVGSGRGFAVHVDVPIQRDEFGFPTIWSSSLKGALRANCASVGLNDKVCKALFGPEPGAGVTESSGASITDARLLFIPARTLKGIWAYTTSTHLLGYLDTYLRAMEGKGLDIGGLRDKVVTNKQELLVNGKIVVNEMFFEKPEFKGNLLDDIGLTRILPRELQNNIASKGLVVVPDDISRILVNRSIVIQYRVRLKPETKTVNVGPWDEEYLPMETILVSLVGFRNVKRGGEEYSAEDLYKSFKNYDGNVLYVGGRETIGKGLVKLYVTEVSVQ